MTVLRHRRILEPWMEQVFGKRGGWGTSRAWIRPSGLSSCVPGWQPSAVATTLSRSPLPLIRRCSKLLLNWLKFFLEGGWHAGR